MTAQTNQNVSRSKTVTNGPSKMDLMLALFDKPDGMDRVIDFELFGTRGNFVTIRSVEAEDNSRESWNIKAQVLAQGGKMLKIYYRTDTRRGHFEIVT